MSRDIFVLGGPTAGNVYPILSTVAELTRRGHRVTYQTAEEFAPLAKEVGASVVSYHSRASDIDYAEVFSADDDGSMPHMIFLNESLDLARTAQTARDENPPEVILYEEFAVVAAHLLASRWNRPSVRLSMGFASNETYSLHDDLVEASGIPGPLTLDRFRSALREELNSRGLDESVDDFWNRVDDRNLVFIPHAFQIAGDSFDDRFKFVGPCLEDASNNSWTPPDSWTPPKDRPVVLLSLGTTFNDHPEFFRECAEAFAESRWHVVMTVGDRIELSDIGTLPANVEAHNWLSHVAVLEHAQVCVTHGGTGTVMQCLHYGRPMVVVPQYAFDVVQNAKQVAELGLGRYVTADDFDVARLPDIVDELSQDADTRKRVREMQHMIHDAGGAERAADEIIAYLESVAS